MDTFFDFRDSSYSEEADWTTKFTNQRPDLITTKFSVVQERISAYSIHNIIYWTDKTKKIPIFLSDVSVR